jgi:hypothetical protein
MTALLHNLRSFKDDTLAPNSSFMLKNETITCINSQSISTRPTSTN